MVEHVKEQKLCVRDRSKEKLARPADLAVLASAVLTKVKVLYA